MDFPALRLAVTRPPHGILHDEHTQLFELLAQLLDVKADDAVIDIYVGVVIENVQTALDVDFQRSRHMAGFRFVLRQQCIVEVFQQRHIFRDGVLEILAVDHMDAAVNDRLSPPPTPLPPPPHRDSTKSAFKANGLSSSE